MIAVDLNCGGGGASLGLHQAGWDVIGIDWDTDACRTHHAAGWPTIRADLTHPIPLHIRPDLVWLSPPCTAFSMAGKGEGRAQADRLIAAIDAEDFAPWPDHDPTVWLTAAEFGHVLEMRPRCVIGENVPAVGPVWEACARVLRRHGYEATVVTLSAEQYGVPQTRARCFLIARTDAAPVTPHPTHQKYVHGEPARAEVTLFGALSPWVSMAEALGWGTPERPYFSLALGGDSADTTGGGSGARAALAELADRPSFVVRTGANSMKHSRVLDRRAQNADGTPVPPVTGDRPAPTMTANGLGHGVFVWRSDPQPNATRSRPDEPAATIKIGHEPPSWAIRVTVAEAATLQGFPDHPWQGSRTSQFRQIGNAVPPALARAIAEANRP